ncbi:hypothetical protein TNCV_2228081 [Trichonephila clavipes]|nr:hypothetical protein TNCV_2228081 [Trichonephila clavipes]
MFYQKLGGFQNKNLLKIQKVIGNDAMMVTRIKEGFNRFKSSRTSLESDQRSSCYEIFSKASVGASEKLRLALSQVLLDTINAEPGFRRLLAVPKNENVIDRIPFSE